MVYPQIYDKEATMQSQRDVIEIRKKKITKSEFFYLKIWPIHKSELSL